MRRNTNAYRTGIAQGTGQAQAPPCGTAAPTILWCIAAKMHADRAAANPCEKRGAPDGAGFWPPPASPRRSINAIASGETLAVGSRPVQGKAIASQAKRLGCIGAPLRRRRATSRSAGG